MAASKFDQSLASGIHFQLSNLAGEWEGRVTTWFEPPKVEDESSINGTIRSVLGGRFVVHEYESAFKGQPTSGIMIIGYNIPNNSFQCSWIDSFHMGTGILFSESEARDNLFSALGSYGGPGMPEPWGWRTTIEKIDDDNIVIRAFNIEPGGADTPATEISYKRKR